LGTLFLFGNGYDVVPDLLTPNEFPARTPLDRVSERGYRTVAQARIPARQRRDASTSDTAPHARNFLDAVKSRQDPSCPIETGHRSTTTTLLGNIALRAGALLEWDAARERIVRPGEANRWLNVPYRAPYRLPKV
jgi:hypothetical protein